MISVTNEQRDLLIKHLPNANKLLESDDVNEILLPLDDLITEIGFQENYELNELGLKLQKIYDEIYTQND